MPTQITNDQLVLYGAIIGAILGFVFGLIPLILGFKRNQKKVGIIGFILILISGIPFSMLGILPVTALFIWLILTQKSATDNTTIIGHILSISIGGLIGALVGVLIAKTFGFSGTTIGMAGVAGADLVEVIYIAICANKSKTTKSEPTESKDF